MTAANPSQKKTGGVFGKLLKYIRPLWGILLAVVLLSFAGSVLNVLIPNFTKDIVNETQNGITGTLDMNLILQYVFKTVLIVLAAFLCNLVQSWFAPLLSQKTAQKMREEMNRKANLIPLNYFDTHAEGDTLSIMTNDIDTVSTSFSSTLPTMITAAATLVGCLILMFITDWILALTTIIASLAGMLISAKVLAKGAPYYQENQALLGRINAQVNEDIKGHLVIKAFNAEKETVESFNETNRELYESSWKSQFVSSLMPPLSIFASNLSYILVCVVGAALVFTGNTRIGTIIAFIQYAQLFSQPISQITQSGGTIQPALAAGARIFTLLEQPEMEDAGKKELLPQAVRGEVDFDHVKFGYNPENIIVHDFSCHVRPGQKVAIVGPTGAGKSTLINLLTRYYEVNSGDIRIDGVSVYDMSREALHNLISIVLQETWTFKGTIRDNIIYSRRDAADEQLREVIRRCGLEDFISKTTDGLDTVLSEDGGISAGQKQLITIARAMIDDAPILILDEATSSVDTRTEKIISAAVDSLMEGRTSFVIAHRLSTIQNADLILVLKDGDIIEMGTHDELIAKKGFYADLYMSQFDK